MKRKLVKMLMGIMTVSAIGGSSVVPVFANDAIDSSAADDSITIHNFITADPDAVIPAHTFSYSVEKVGIGDDNHASVLADMPDLTIGDITTSGTQQTTETGVAYANKKVKNTVDADGLTTMHLGYGSGATADTADTDGVNWPYAGFYHYFVTEATPAVSDWEMNCDKEGYQVDILVANEGGTLVTKSTTVRKATKTNGKVVVGDKVNAGDEDTDGDGDPDTTNAHAMAFRNKYDPTVQLSVKKTITGNAADMTKTFKLTLSDLVLPEEQASGAATEFHATSTTGTHQYKGQTVTNPTTVKPGVDAVFYLGEKETFDIADLPVGTTYKVTEEGEKNYTTTYTVTEAGVDNTTQTGQEATGTVKATADAKDTENAVSYNDDYEVPTPTGFVVNNFPAVAGIAMTVLGGTGMAISRNRKRKDEE
ncbi:MAG: hypothetical protein K5744_02065 [Eubacterium sp.]|nr:hypothetical protein [Eubacterium sp.]